MDHSNKDIKGDVKETTNQISPSNSDSSTKPSSKILDCKAQQNFIIEKIQLHEFHDSPIVPGEKEFQRALDKNQISISGKIENTTSTITTTTDEKCTNEDLRKNTCNRLHAEQSQISNDDAQFRIVGKTSHHKDISDLNAEVKSCSTSPSAVELSKNNTPTIKDDAPSCKVNNTAVKEISSPRDHKMENKCSTANNSPSQQRPQTAPANVRPTTVDKNKKKVIRLPNATVGTYYSYTENLSGTENISMNMVEVKQFPVEVNINSEKKISIQGTPSKAGDFIFDCGYALLSLTVNNNPKDLWKNIPSNQNIEYFKEDRVHQCLDIENSKRMIAASIRGRSHAHVGSCRDDDFCLHHFEENGWNLMVCADGAGSAKFSRYGSKLACDTVCESFKKELNSEDVKLLHLDELDPSNLDTTISNQIGTLGYHLVTRAALAAYQKIEEEAKNKGYEIKDYATTLLVAACKKLKQGWLVITFSVGDGAIALLSKNNDGVITSKLYSKPDEGEFSGQTMFLTMGKILADPTSLYQRFRVKFVDSFEAIIAMTDGVSDPLFETTEMLESDDKWRQLWEDLHEVRTSDNPSAQLEKWLDFWSVGNHDDRTMVILY